MPRREDARLLIGGGRFVDDHFPKKACHAVMYRSPVAHASIRSLDIAKARAVSGVLAVLRQADLDDAGCCPMRSRTPVTSLDGSPMIEPERPVLARDNVKYAGQPVAFIVAENEATALDGLDAIEAEYENLPVVIGTDQAAASREIWTEAPGNQSFIWELGNGEETERAIAEAIHVTRLMVRHPRIVVSPIEPRGALGEFDVESGRFTLTTPSQGTVSLRAAMAEILDVSEKLVRVVTHDVGGSFAVKIWPYPEQALVLFAARMLGRPVKWVASRSESSVADAQGRARTDHATLALDANGRFVAFRIEADGDLGAYLNTVAPSVFTAGACRTFGHNYDIPCLHYRVRGLFTNTTPTDAYRGAGKPESVGTLERLIDVAAAEFGMDRIELRRRNLIQQTKIPHATAMGEEIDAGDFPGIFEKALAAADWDGYSARKFATETKGFLRGRAAGMHMHATGGSVAECVQVRALSDGTIRVRTSSQDSGQAHADTLAEIVAEALGIQAKRVFVEQGDSDTMLIGGSTGGSNLLPVSANTAHRSALAMIERAREMAAGEMEAAIQDIEYEAGSLRITGTDRSLSLAELVSRFPYVTDTPVGHGQPAGCVGELSFEGKHTTFPNGAYVIEVEVDPDTGRVSVERVVGVDDLGRIIHDGSAVGQIMGGLAQAVGEVLMESMVFGTDGQPLSASLMDYALPRAGDLPMFDLSWSSTDSPNSLLGVKGVGELSSIGGPGPISNAMHDALAPFGIKNLDNPLTPEKVWRAIQIAKSGT